MNLSKTLKSNDLKYFVVILLMLLSGCKENSEKSNSDSFYYVSEKLGEKNDFYFLFEQISNLHRQDRLVGAEVLIIRNDSIQLHDVVGWSDKEKKQKLRKNSIYRIRSMTKPIVATAILILIDEGKLALEDPVSKYIKSFDNPRSRSITIKQCLTHTSGLASHDYEEIGLTKEPNEFETLSEVVEEIGQIGTISEPGNYRYSGSGTAVLTEIISLISGFSAENFIQDRIFMPLEMSSAYTSFNPSVKWASNLNPTYRWVDSINGFIQYWNPTLEPEYKYFRGHGGVYCSALDYAKFLSMWLHKGKHKDTQILSKETIDLAQTTTVEQSLRAPYTHQSLAWMMIKPDTNTNKIGYFMHGGADGTLAYAFPNEHTIALYFNQSRNHPRFVFQDLLAITEPYDTYRKSNFNSEYLDKWKEIILLEKRAENKTLDAQFETYLGTYKCVNNGGFDSEIINKNGQLILKNLQSGSECKLFHDSENEFICRFRPPPDGLISKVIFEQEEDGTLSFSLEWFNTRKFEFKKVK